jgi:hypothetical protein
MSDYAFDAAAPTIRYVSASASGSDNGTAIGTPWTWAQFVTASASNALNGADVWIVGNLSVSSTDTIGSGHVTAAGANQWRPLRIIGCISTPGDVTTPGTGPTITVTGSNRTWLTFSNPGVVLANLCDSSAGRVQIQFNSDNCIVDGCNLQTSLSTTNDFHPVYFGSSQCRVSNSICSGGETGLPSSEGIDVQGSFLRGGIRGTSIPDNSTAWRCIIVGRAQTWQRAATFTDCVVICESTGAFTAATNGALEASRCIVVGPNSPTAIGPNTACVLRDNLFAPYSGATLPALTASHTARGYATNNQFVTWSPFTAHATGDLRLSANGRTNRRCVETMLGLVNVPLPSGWQMDDAATLRGYLAAIDGFRRSLSFSMGGF